MFKDYSQTYVSQLTALAGMLVVIAQQLGWSLTQEDFQLVLGILVTVVGNVWGLIHRSQKGDITVLGKRINTVK